MPFCGEREDPNAEDRPVPAPESPEREPETARSGSLYRVGEPDGARSWY